MDAFGQLDLALAAQAAGIHQLQVMAVPAYVSGDRVARNAGGVERDGSAPADQSIEERRLAHVGPSEDDDPGHRLAHSPRSSRNLGSSCQSSLTLTCRWR